MTTPLPAAPSLEQLRKQAKELVRERRAGGEPLRLSDAQLALAREYGFPSWPKLKAYVDRVSANGPALTHAFVDDIGYYEDRAEGLRSVVESGLPSGIAIVRTYHPALADASDAEIRALSPGDSEARARTGARLRELGGVPSPRGRPGRERRALPARVPRDPGARRQGARRAARPLPRTRQRARHERQRPARAGCQRRLRPPRPGDGAGAARARRRPERRQRPWLDCPASGGLRQRHRARPPAAGLRRAHRPRGTRRGRNAARRRALLGTCRQSPTSWRSGASCPATCASRPASAAWI